MRPDVATIRKFYDSPLGDFAAASLAAAVADCDWVDRPGALVSLGYATPILDRFGQGAAATALMPAGQGVARWPSEGPVMSALVNELDLPIEDASVSNMLLVHALEFTSDPSALLREVWRVLEPEGRVVIIVPNRHRIWASREQSPFGHGRPWSRHQLSDLLLDRMLTPVKCRTALFYPPTKMAKTTRRLAGLCERPMLRAFPASGGLLIVEASKKVVGGILQGETRLSLKEATIGNVANMIQK